MYTRAFGIIQLIFISMAVLALNLLLKVDGLGVPIRIWSILLDLQISADKKWLNPKVSSA